MMLTQARGSNLVSINSTTENGIFLIPSLGQNLVAVDKGCWIRTVRGNIDIVDYDGWRSDTSYYTNLWEVHANRRCVGRILDKNYNGKGTAIVSAKQPSEHWNYW